MDWGLMAGASVRAGVHTGPVRPAPASSGSAPGPCYPGPGAAGEEGQACPGLPGRGGRRAGLERSGQVLGDTRSALGRTLREGVGRVPRERASQGGPVPLWPLGSPRPRWAQRPSLPPAFPDHLGCGLGVRVPQPPNGICASWLCRSSTPWWPTEGQGQRAAPCPRPAAGAALPLRGSSRPLRLQPPGAESCLALCRPRPPCPSP